MAKDVWEQLKDKLPNVPTSGEMFPLPNPNLTDIFCMQLKVQRGSVSSPIHKDLMDNSVPGAISLQWDSEQFQKYFKEFALAANLEIGEAVEWTPWKSWKTYPREIDGSAVQNCKFELVDCFMFLLNMWLMLGGDAKEFYQFCIAKQQENLRRQQDGYVHAPNDRG